MCSSDLAFVFQFFHLLPTLTVLENVCLPALQKKSKTPQKILADAKQMLIQLGLGEAWHKLPSQLSGGMLARSGLARALLTEPDILFADEPTGSLDSSTGKTILSLLQQEQKRLGFTFVLVTHDAHAATMAQRILKMQDGVLLT